MRFFLLQEDFIMDKVRVGIIGSHFIATIHAEAFKAVPDAEDWAIVLQRVSTNAPSPADQCA